MADKSDTTPIPPWAPCKRPLGCDYPDCECHSQTTDPKEVIRLALVAQFNGGHDEGPYCYGDDAQLIVDALDNAGCILRPPPLTPSEQRKRERQRKAELKGFRI